MNLSKSVFTIGSLTIVSRMAGYVRDMFVAATMGAGPLTDAFLIAFRLPNFFRRLFAEGAFNSAFVPLFASVLTEKGHKKAAEVLEKVMSVMIIVLVLLCVVFQIFMPYIMYVFAPGFAKNPEQFELTTYLTRITFPYLLFISIVSLFGGVLNTLGKFAAAAASPILLNICLIFALFAFAPFVENNAHALAWGVALSGVVQVFFLYLSLRKNGFTPKLRKPHLSPEVKKVMKLMIPGTIGAGVVQINLWVDTIIATMIPNAVSYLYYADRIAQLPLAVIGTAVGTALLPLLARQLKEKKHKEAMQTQNRALELAMFFTLPAAVALFVISNQVVSVLFERGKFQQAESLETALALSAYAVGLPAFVLLKLLINPFFARQDTKTPVIYSAISVGTNILFNIIFIFILRHYNYHPHIGIALATGLASWINVAMLCHALKKRHDITPDKTFKRRMRGIIVSSIIMGAALYALDAATSGLQEAGGAKLLLAVMITISCGGGLFFVAAHFTKAFDLHQILGYLKKPVKGKSVAQYKSE